MGYQAYGQPAGVPGMEPPEAESVKSLLHVARILAIIFGILLLLGGLLYAAAVVAFYESCTSTLGSFCNSGLGAVLVFPILIVIWGVVDFVIYVQMKEIESLVVARQYEAAKAKTLLWMILGFILGGILLGIVLLLAFLKFDPLINWQRNTQGGAGAFPPPPGAAPMAGAPPPPPPTTAGAAPPFCPSCGKPTTYVAQYGRYYCTSCQKYV